jgi:RNA polymerase sigma-70 factor, ECF subfamily
VVTAAIKAEAATTSPEPSEQFHAGRLDTEVARARVEELFSAHRLKVQRICGALLRDRHESEDAAQQTFLSAFRALRNGAEPREAEAWLGSIARNECLGRIRDRMREPLPTLQDELEDSRADVHRQAISNMNTAHLWQEIQSLPDQQRDAIVLREFAGLSYDELAVALGVSDAAVESLLFRARVTLRRRLQTTLASVNLAGVASGAASALARIFAGGVAPIATKAAAVGVGTVFISGSMFVGGGALTGPQASPLKTHVRQRAAVPVAVPVTISTGSARIVSTLSQPRGSDGQGSAELATNSEGDGGGGQRGSSPMPVLVPSADGREHSSSSDGTSDASGHDDGGSGHSMDGTTTGDGGD